MPSHDYVLLTRAGADVIGRHFMTNVCPDELGELLSTTRQLPAVCNHFRWHHLGTSAKYTSFLPAENWRY